MSTGPHPPAAGDLAPEEAVRAELYGLLAHLFAQGPAAQVLAGLGNAAADLGADGSELALSWQGLKLAARAADAQVLAIEHAELFVGVGRARISIYAAHYLSDTWKEHTLVDLRDQLQRLGLGRQAGVSQPEDHLAALLEVMRHLALRGADDDAVQAQRSFFNRYLAPWVGTFCTQTMACSGTGFYFHAARMLGAFCAVEAEAFGLGG